MLPKMLTICPCIAQIADNQWCLEVRLLNVLVLPIIQTAAGLFVLPIYLTLASVSLWKLVISVLPRQLPIIYIVLHRQLTSFVLSQLTIACCLYIYHQCRICNCPKSFQYVQVSVSLRTLAIRACFAFLAENYFLSWLDC